MFCLLIGPVITIAAVYMKNSVVKHWKERDPDDTSKEEFFCIEERSKAVVREHIIKAIIETSPSIRWAIEMVMVVCVCVCVCVRACVCVILFV